MEMRKIAEIEFSPNQRETFRCGELLRIWAKQYPQLFDSDDIRLAKSQPEYHFFEWLAAVVIYNTTGYLSLVEKYQFHNHKRKRRILGKILSEEQLRILECGNVQCPDLFVYSRDYKDWFFCEVKGKTDRLRQAQRKFFEQLMEITNKPVVLIQFKEK
jgi:hypothetical protein